MEINTPRDKKSQENIATLIVMEDIGNYACTASLSFRSFEIATLIVMEDNHETAVETGILGFEIATLIVMEDIGNSITAKSRQEKLSQPLL